MAPLFRPMILLLSPPSSEDRLLDGIPTIGEGATSVLHDKADLQLCIAIFHALLTSAPVQPALIQSLRRSKAGFVLVYMNVLHVLLLGRAGTSKPTKTGAVSLLLSEACRIYLLHEPTAYLTKLLGAFLQRKVEICNALWVGEDGFQIRRIHGRSSGIAAEENVLLLINSKKQSELDALLNSG